MAYTSASTAENHVESQKAKQAAAAAEQHEAIRQSLGFPLPLLKPTNRQKANTMRARKKAAKAMNRALQALTTMA